MPVDGQSGECALPAVLHLNAGGFVAGYRLAPEHPRSAAVLDC